MKNLDNKILTINTISAVFTQICSVLILQSAAVMAAKNLGPEAIGQYNWSLYILSYFAILTNMGLIVIGRREVSKRPELSKSIFAILSSFQLLSAAFCYTALIGMGLYLRGPGMEATVFAVLGLTLCLTAVRPNWVLQAHQRIVVTTAVNTVCDLATLGLTIALVRDEANLLLYAQITTVSLGLKVILDIAYSSRHQLIKVHLPRLKLRRVVPFLRASIPVAISSASTTLYYNVDSLMIAGLYGDGAVGQYSVAYGTMLIFVTPCFAVLTAFTPQLTASRNYSRTHMLNVARTFLNVMFFIGLPLSAAVVMWGNGIFVAVYGEAFQDGAKYFALLGVNISLVYINVGLANPLILWGQQRYHMFITLISAGANVVLNIVLLPRFGPSGAIFATIACEIMVLMLACNYRLRNGLLNLSWRHFCIPLTATLIVVAISLRGE